MWGLTCIMKPTQRSCWNTKLGEITFGNKPSEFPRQVRKVSRFVTEDKTAVYGLENACGYGRALAVWLIEKGFHVKDVNTALSYAQRKSVPMYQKSDSYDAEAVALVLINMLDKLPDAIPDDKYWTLGQLVNRRDNICTHLHRLKNQFFTGEEPEAGKLGAGVSQALAERLFSEEILGGLAEGLGIPEETVTAQEETGTDSSDTANADYGQTMTATPGNAAPGAVSPGNAAASYAGKNDNGNNGNGGNGNHYGWGNGNNGNGNGNNGNGNGNSSTGGTNDNNGNANGNTNNTGGSQNQSGILFPAEGEVSELEQELIDMIKTTGKQKNYELVEYVNDVNRDHVEVLMELNINGIMDTAYSYGNERLTNERFTGWTGYYTYDPRGSVTGVTGSDGYIWQSYRYNAYGGITFGKPQYNNVYSYNAESFNPNIDAQYLRSRYYSVKTAGFISEDSYLGNITDPLTLNRYNYVKSSPLNYVDPSGNWPGTYYGFQVERKTVLARMQEMGIQAIYPRQSTSRRDPSHKVYPYLLKDVSAAYPDHVWSIDITYIPIQKSWLYLTAIIDWYSRYVLAWEINDTLEIPFVLDACRRALERSQPVIMNNDQGNHFTSPKYTRLFQETGCLISMDHRGRAYDNIFIERFWRSLKYEDIYLKDYQYPREARKGIYQYLEYYNNERLHQSLGYRTPASLYYGSK